MSHLETLLLNEIRKPLEEMQRKQVGFIDYEDVNSIYYKIDGRSFCIDVTEIKDTNN